MAQIMHYGVKGNATLGHSVRDADGGFTLASMRKGIRLTTGVEFADRDAPPSPVQLARDEPSFSANSNESSLPDDNDFPVQFPDETRHFPVRGRREFSRKALLSFQYSAPFGCSQQAK